MWMSSLVHDGEGGGGGGNVYPVTTMFFLFFFFFFFFFLFFFTLYDVPMYFRSLCHNDLKGGFRTV